MPRISHASPIEPAEFGARPMRPFAAYGVRAGWEWSLSNKPRPNVGRLIITAHPLDLAIGGAGWFVVAAREGKADAPRPILTRVGIFSLSEQGAIVDEHGGELFPPVRMPGELSTVVINSWGDVIAISRSGEFRIVGGIRLAGDDALIGALEVGPGRYQSSRSPDSLAIHSPGVRGFGVILQGAIEVPPGHEPEVLGPRFSEPLSVSGPGVSIRFSSSGMLHFARFLKHARRRRESRLDIQIAHSQAARLLTALRNQGAPVPASSEPIRADLFSSTLAARRLTAGQISDLLRYVRRFDPERFLSIPAEEEATRGVVREPGQGLQVAQARAAESWRG